MSTLIEPNATVLFQGDSITDAGRSRQDDTVLGRGYAMMAAAWFQSLYPERNVTFINRGISGNRVVDLQQRWDEDCIDLKPSWVSILIGINDTWRKFDRGDETATESYAAGYEHILTRVKEETDAKIIICEPFVLPVPDDRKLWRKDLDPKIQVARNLAGQFNAIYIPFDGMFAQVSSQVSPAYFAKDGVHPTPAGHALMAQAWLKAVRAT